MRNLPERPDDEGLEDLLKSICPQPTDRFYRAMEQAAWNRSNPRLLYFRSLLATAFLMLVLVWTIPMVRMGAEELYDALFDQSQVMVVNNGFSPEILTRISHTPQ